MRSIAGGRVPPIVVGAIAIAWGLAVAAEAAGSAGRLHHDALLAGDVGPLLAVVLFLLAWQMMVAAMMLPSSLPLIRHFGVMAGRQEHPRATLAAFLGGYLVVWTAFGSLAFAADALVHEVVDRWRWLSARPWALSGGVLLLAGLFQFSALKDRCLRVCRHPAGFLLRFYESGVEGAWRLGRRHGLFCVGCCWALMLVMFAAGLASLWWMTALTTLMVVEKAAPWGERAVPLAGLALLAWGAAVLAQPAWLPDGLGGPASL